MAAVGSLNDFVKFQMGQGLEKGAGVGGIGAEMAVGMAIAQQMLNQPGGPGDITGQATPGVGASAVSAVPETLSPAEAAKVLGVAESDVLASLDKGDLKGKRIGTQWRVTRAHIAEFLR